MLLDKRLVIKVGTSTLTHGDGKMNLRSIDRLACVLSDIQNMGYEVVLVSSGAIAVGANKMHMKHRPTELRLKQAAAAVGQCELMFLYDKFFGDYCKTVGQILLTGDDVSYPYTKDNLCGTFDALLDLGIIPIVNENDSVSYTEIELSIGERKVFGDNDTLSAVVAKLCRAKTLVLMSDVDGLYDGNPQEKPDAHLISEVTELTDNIKKLAGGAGSSHGTGGMITKLHAAEVCMETGIDMYIMNGAKPDLLYGIVEGNHQGTRFVGKSEISGCEL